MFTDEVVVSNTVLVDGSGTPLPVSGPLTDLQLRATPVPVSTTPVVSGSATVTPVILTANTNATLLAANPNRVGITLFVPSSPCYLKFGATASSTSFSIKVTANNTQLFADDFKNYAGRIDILSQNGQTVLVTEY